MNIFPFQLLDLFLEPFIFLQFDLEEILGLADPFVDAFRRQNINISSLVIRVLEALCLYITFLDKFLQNIIYRSQTKTYLFR